MSKTSKLMISAACVALTIFAAAPAFAQNAEEVVVTGSRAANRTRLDTVAPVDVVSANALSNAGSTEVSQALALTLPSLDFPRPAITDGTDSVRPATLRGLAPDQTLVLINSKRAHTAALYYPDDMHLNAAGNAALAEILQGWLQTIEDGE